MKNNLILEKVWKWFISIIILGAVIFCFISSFKEHPWISSFILLGLILWAGLMYMIFAGWDEVERGTADDIRERYGEIRKERDFMVYECKPNMNMVNKATSEKTLGFQVPPYFIIDSYGMPPNFTGDYFECVELHFDIPLPEETIAYLETQCNNSKTKWSKENNTYKLKVDEIDLERHHDHYFTIEVEKDGMVITEGRV